MILRFGQVNKTLLKNPQHLCPENENMFKDKFLAFGEAK
jgi:hypothetical protein